MKKRHSKGPNKIDIGKESSFSVKEHSSYYIFLFVILLISFIAFLPVLQNGFVNWDDDQYIQENLLLHSMNFKNIFSDYFMGNYHPLTMLVFSIEYKYFGLNPFAFHFVNLIIHLLSTLLVYKVIKLISNKNEIALVTALLFGIHPIHVESVAWASELKDLLYAFFFLASFIFYLKYTKKNEKKYYVCSLLLFIPALLSKAMAASLPVALIITDYFLGKKINLRNLISKIPFFILAIIFGIVAILAQQSSGSIAENSVYPFSQRIVFASYGYISYLIKIVFPFHLSAFYPYPINNGEEIPGQYYTYLVLLICIFVYIFYSLQFTKKIFFAFGFFTVTVFLVLQFIPVGSAIMADRYSYIPSVGLFYLAAEGIYLWWNKRVRIFTILAVGTLTILFSMKTFARCKIWKDGITMWSDVIRQYQNIALAYNRRGGLFDNLNRKDEAFADYSQAIKLNPKYDKAFNNRGNLLMKENNFVEAIKDYNKTIELKLEFFGGYRNRGNLFMSINKTDSAFIDYTKAIALQSFDADIYFYRANLLSATGRYEEAVKDYDKAIEIRTNYSEAFFSRAMLFMNTKKFDAAFKDFSYAIKLNPYFTEAFMDRGNLLQNLNRVDGALKDYSEAIKIRPKNPKIYYNRGNLLGGLKSYEEAIKDFSQAISIKGDYALAFFGRGITENNVGRKDQGCNDIQHAISLGFQPALEAYNNICR